MTNPILKTLGIVVAIVLFSGLSPTMATGKPSPCQKTAIQMYKACNYDKQDNLKTILANCSNLNDRSARETCQQEARETSRDEAQSCKEQFRARAAVCDMLGEERYDPDPLQDPTIAFVDPDYVNTGNPNPYVSIVKGHTYVLRAGKEGEEIVVVHVTGDVRTIHGIPCRVVVDIVLESEENEEDGSIEYVPLEVTDDWFTQDVQGNVYYCGELSRNYQDGLLANLDGSFEAGREFAKAGALIMAYPDIGSAHRQEFALGEAEDIIQYLDLAAYPEQENEQFPCSDNGGCLMTYEYTPLEPEAAAFKYYIAGVGFVLAEALENGELTGERDTLVCVGEDLAVLQQPACGIEDPGELLETLCEVSPEAFCE
jgi:hypothetical protein